MNRKKVLTSLAWKLLERLGSQGIAFIVQIILARMLIPSDYGILALITVFIVFANVFVQSGLNTALIQKKDADETDFSTVFYLSLFIAAILYIVLFISAPFIARFYNNDSLSDMLRVLSITLFFGAFNSIQIAKVARELNYKVLMGCSISAIIISGIIGVTLAYLGYGVWALVAQQLSNQILICITMLFRVKWYPKLCFSFTKLKPLYSFGWKLLVSNLLININHEIQSLIIGKKYSTTALGFYNRGRQFPLFASDALVSSFRAVLLPTLSSIQDKKNDVKMVVRRSASVSSYVIFPLMIGLAAIAKPLVQILLTDAWLDSVPFLQLFCVVFMFQPLCAVYLQAISAIGRSDLYLKIDFIKKPIELLIIILAVILFDSVLAIAIGSVISVMFSTLVNAIQTGKLLNYTFKEQFSDVFPALVLSSIMGICVYLMSLLSVNQFIILFMQVIVGTVIYIAISIIARDKSFYYIIDILKSAKRKKRGV